MSKIIHKFMSNGSNVSYKMKDPRRLIVVANRLPFVVAKKPDGTIYRKTSAGGLVTAVAPVVVESDGKWVGWPGSLYDGKMTIPDSDPNDRSPTAGMKSSNVYPVMLSQKIYDSYYNDCCNGTLWPLFHSMPDRTIFSAKAWKGYIKANQIFASSVIKALETLTTQNNDYTIIWVHDYHLTLISHAVREYASNKHLNVQIGFFLHTPFPSWDLFRLFPWADDVLQGMLACDLIGMHTHDYCINFVDCCYRRLGTRIDRSGLLVEHGGRTVRVMPLPIGVPFDRFTELAKQAQPTSSNKKRRILGVDRLDYTKGLPNRLRAFELLLEKHPEYIGKVELLQIAVPSRTDVKEYQELKEEMDMLVGHINGRFSTANWSPIRYIYGTVEQTLLAGFYRDSAVGYITPLRDGMNLVAKEFVACQVNSIPGVLIISPFAGAGQSMVEALICNPYELNETMETLHRALSMPDDEKILRMTYLKKREKAEDVNNWMASFFDALTSLQDEQSNEAMIKPHIMKPVSVSDFDEYFKKWPEMFDKKLSLILDYDGTIVPFANHPDRAVIQPHVKEILQKISLLPNIHISIISGRLVENLKKMVGLSNITYAGSQGLNIIYPDGTTFQYQVPSVTIERAEELKKELQAEVTRDGAWVEFKKTYMTVHYRNTPLHLRPELEQKASNIILKHGFILTHSHSALEANPDINWDKGRAAIEILKNSFGLDWANKINIVFLGDDVTDEKAIRALKGMAFTFRITHGNIVVKTSADQRLPSTDCVYTLLQWILRNFSKPTTPSSSTVKPVPGPSAP